jgi:hypothetical protein
MKTTETQLQEKIAILISNTKEALTDTKEMVDLLGNEKFETKKGNIALNDMFNFSKMDIDAFIPYLFISGQNQKYYGDLTIDVLQVLFCGEKPVVSKKIMNALVKTLLK